MLKNKPAYTGSRLTKKKTQKTKTRTANSRPEGKQDLL